MPEFPVQAVPIYGGFAVHNSACDCDERENMPDTVRIVRYPATSLADTIARMYADGHASPHSRDRFVVVDCTRNLPRYDATPMTWQERHRFYTLEAARAVWELSQRAVRMARESGDQLINSRRDHTGALHPIWNPLLGDIRAVVQDAARARHLAACVDGLTGQPNTAEECERVVLQTEEQMRKATETLMEELSHCDTTSRFRYEAERVVAQRFIANARDALSSVYAHRACRDIVN